MKLHHFIDQRTREGIFHVCFATFDLDSNERCQGSAKEKKPEYH